MMSKDMIEDITKEMSKEEKAKFKDLVIEV